MDVGHEMTEAELKKLEKRIYAEYAKAAKEMTAKYEAWAKNFEAADAAQQAKLAAGEITKGEYQQWVIRQRLGGKQWQNMANALAQDMVNADKIARGIAADAMPDIYALNANYGTFQILSGAPKTALTFRDKATGEKQSLQSSFTLYNHDTAEMLLKNENIQLMPGPSGAKAEKLRQAVDMRWNRQKINSAVLQGILQGESNDTIARRLRSVAGMDANAAIRYARTMTTSAQNAGRYQAYRRARDLGVQLTIEWSATLDNRTRHEHRQMHGQRREVDEPFVITEANGDTFEILYPADATGTSDAPQGEIWNCRCTLLAWVKGFEHDTVKSSPKLDGMTFEEWLHANESEEEAEAS